MEWKELAILVGLIVGSAVLGSVCYVWVRQQVFGMGGTVLSAFGTVLIGLSVWSNIQITIGDTVKIAAVLPQRWRIGGTSRLSRLEIGPNSLHRF